jgi:3-hydroxyacyl-[acyl-carrier-protein] dehydratase
MRFHLLDRITAHEPGKSLTAEKVLALGEEYLADHFPRFPVMPGVLMLQAVAEAGSWLWRRTSDYAHPMIVVRGVRNVKYGTFMQPGRRMTVTVELAKQDGESFTIKGKGVNDAGESTVSAQITLHGYSMAARSPAGADADRKLIEHWKARWALLTGELNPALRQ